MRVLILGGTWFLGRRITERLAQRGDQIMPAHRGSPRSAPGLPGTHLTGERHDLARHAGRIKDFDPQAVVDTHALTAADVDAVLPVLPHVPTVVLSSQDVYEAYTGLQAGRCLAPVPITEESELRRGRYPYRGRTRAYVDDLATAVLSALDTRAADGQALNLGESGTVTVGAWVQQILDAAGSGARLVRVPDDALPPTWRCPARPRSTCWCPRPSPRNCSAGRPATRRRGWPSRCAGTWPTRRTHPGPSRTPRRTTPP